MVSLSSRGLNIRPAPVLDIVGFLAKPGSLSPRENLIIRWVAALLSDAAAHPSIERRPLESPDIRREAQFSRCNLESCQ
jgi:hypothetical protein